MFNLACAGRTVTASASQAERLALSQSLARQARHLLQLASTQPRAAEQLTVAAVAGAALAGGAGQGLLKEGLTRLGVTLEETVRPDGGHASRSPQAGLELLFDLLALEYGLSQRGVAPPDAVSRAIDRLTTALGSLTLSDGRLVALQGGETGRRDHVAAARAHGQGGEAELTIPTEETPRAGYQRLNAPGLQVVVDAAAPAEGPWSLGACGQPMAIEVVCGRDRLITGSGWSPEAAAPQALRMASAASTATVGLGHLGAPLGGFAGRALGQRLVGGVKAVTCSRRENEAGVWVDLAHEGWVRQAGLIHERRLFLDKTTHELRGEDRFVPTGPPRPASLPIAIYFHLHPEVTAVLARDQRSVLLRGASEIGWWLRNDAGEVSIENTVHLDDGRPRRAEAVALRARLRADRGGRVRWKLTLAEPAPEPVKELRATAD
ncbi:MAG TPA: heparinase II/III family protein [Caulobacteraceae bacterium]|nr:heparinase II/III family protein [Caulobacteraceae bacterium]